MKKSFIILFAVLVLICAVACSSNPKASGIRIFASEGASDFLEDNDLVLKYVKLESEEDVKEVKFDDILGVVIMGSDFVDGPITIFLDPGVYAYRIYNGETEYGTLEIKAPETKYYIETRLFVVSEGDIIDYELSCWN